MVTRKVHPSLTFGPYAVETFCVLLCGVGMPFWVATEWRFAIMNELGDVGLDVRGIHWIVSEIPVIV
jgi:hypothetical protein